MTIEHALSILRKGGVPRPFLQNSRVFRAESKKIDGTWQDVFINEEWWEVCSLGVDNYNVILLGEGPTIDFAMKVWKRAQTSIIKTKKATASL